MLAIFRSAAYRHEQEQEHGGLGDLFADHLSLLMATWAAWAPRGPDFLPQGSTSAYSGMPGEPRYDMQLEPKYKNKQLEKAMKAPIDQDAIRKAGW